jgi:hypothetical protein
MFEHWTRCEATVVARQVRTAPAGYEATYDFVLDVVPPDAPPLRVTIHEGTFGPKGGFRNPAVGEVVGVLYDARSRKVKFDNDDPRLNASVADQARSDSFGATATADPGTPPPAPFDPAAAMRALTEQTRPMPVAAPGRSAVDRLATLRDLHDQGMLSDQEYETQRQRIISSI